MTEQCRPPELYQAQVASFAGTLDPCIGRLVLDRIIDATEATLPTIDLTEVGQCQVPDTPTQKELESQFQTYLHGGSKEHQPEITGRFAILNSYAKFAPVVAGLKDGMGTLVPQRNQPNFLGSGSNSRAFLVKVDGNEYVVRIPDTTKHTARVIDPHIVAGYRARGVVGLEQIIAASYVDGVTVAHRMPGREVPKTTRQDIVDITNAHVADLIATVLAANRLSLNVDAKTSNFFFDPEKGFGIIDLVPGRHGDQTEGSVVVSGLQAICNMGGLQRSKNQGFRANNDPSAIVRTLEALLPKILLYRRIARDMLAGETREYVLRGVDEILKSTAESKDQYANPQWIAAQEELAQQGSSNAVLPLTIEPDNID